MSPIESAFLVAGAVATILFFADYVRGAWTAIATHSDAEIEVDDSGDVQAYWWQIAAAVAAAAVIIGLAGVSPAFVYLGPALAIVTAASNGLAFFLEDGPKPGA
jgi:hypothetical protein